MYPLSDVYQVADPEYMEAVVVANAFNSQVAKMPDASKLTLADKENVDNLTKVYEAMSSYQKTYISADALKKYKELVTKMQELTGSTSGSTGSDTTTEGTGTEESTGAADGESAATGTTE